MIDFIMQEAGEKCKEIKIKADEEFNVERAKSTRNEVLLLEQHYSRKLRQLEVKKKMYY